MCRFSIVHKTVCQSLQWRGSGLHFSASKCKLSVWRFPLKIKQKGLNNSVITRLPLLQIDSSPLFLCTACTYPSHSCVMFPSDQCSLAQWLLLRTGHWQQPGHGSPNRNEGLLVERRNMLSIFIPCKPSFNFSKDIERNCYLLDFCGHKNVGSGEILGLGYLWNPTSGVIHVFIVYIHIDCEPFYLPGSPGLSLHTKLWSGLHQALSVSTIPYNSALLDFKDFWFL